MTYQFKPRKKSRKPMEISIMQIVKASGFEAEFLAAIEKKEEFHLKVENEPYMPLVIEVVFGGFVSVSHSFIQNGDNMYDPEIVFNTAKKWSPVGITQSPMGISRHLEYEKAVEGYYIPGVAQLANMWALNLRSQGFADDDCTFTSLTHTVKQTAEPMEYPEENYQAAIERQKFDEESVIDNAMASMERNGNFDFEKDTVDEYLPPANQPEPSKIDGINEYNPFVAGGGTGFDLY